MNRESSSAAPAKLMTVANYFQGDQCKHKSLGHLRADTHAAITCGGVFCFFLSSLARILGECSTIHSPPELSCFVLFSSRD